MTETQPNKNKAAVLWISLAIIAASIEPIVVKLGYAGNIKPTELLLVKNVTGALLIVPMTWSFGKLRWIGFANLKKIMAVALLLFCTNALTMFALQSISAVLMITIVTTTPAFVALMNERMGRDVLAPTFWLGFILCFVGVVMGMNFSDISFNTMGLVMIFGAVISSTCYRVQMESTTAEFSPALVSTYTFLIMGILTLIFITPFVGGIPQKASWGIGGWIGLAAAAANVAFLYALNLVGSTRISLLNMLQRPAMVLAAAVVLHEPLTWQTGLGIVLATIGIQLAKVTKRTHPQMAATDSVTVAGETEIEEVANNQESSPKT